MLTDLQKVNKCIKPMGTLQLGLSSPALIPQNWSLMVLNLKDRFFLFCFVFFAIPLQFQDRDKFAFQFLFLIILSLLNIINRRSYHKK